MPVHVMDFLLIHSPHTMQRRPKKHGSGRQHFSKSGWVAKERQERTMKTSILLITLALVPGASVGANKSSVSDTDQDKQCEFKAVGGRVRMVDKWRRCVSVLSELEAVFAERVKAVKNIDAEAQVAQVSPDYSATEPDGQTLTYDQIVTYMRRSEEHTSELQSHSFISY